MNAQDFRVLVIVAMFVNENSENPVNLVFLNRLSTLFMGENRVDLNCIAEINVTSFKGKVLRTNPNRLEDKISITTRF